MTWAGRYWVLAVTVVLASCSGGTQTPLRPSSDHVGGTTASGVVQGAGAGVVEDTSSSGAGPVAMPSEAQVTAHVSFPPRNEPFMFRQELESKYRDGLRRTPSQSFVDLEGSIVWTQEYLRYRVNQCSHDEAIFRVFRQIDGFGVAAVCSNVERLVFPPRDQPFDFRLQLERKYRDQLRRGATATYVDNEGDIVWTQEYLRYRLSGCSHVDATSKVFTQIDGRGVQPDCTPPPPPPSAPTTPSPSPSPSNPTPGPSGRGAFIEFRSDSRTCGCTVGTIRLQIDGNQVGTMGCSGSGRFEVSPGTHTTNACDNVGCWGQRSQNVTLGSTWELTLTCVSTTSAPQKLYSAEIGLGASTPIGN